MADWPRGQSLVKQELKSVSLATSSDRTVALFAAVLVGVFKSRHKLLIGIDFRVVGTTLKIPAVHIQGSIV